jgi:uncharacterized protein YodC (DUF2158 family)
MRFKPGDLVIKNTGGNKMRILECKDDGVVDCVWATENLHEGLFNEEDLLPISEYQSVIIGEKRDDMINKILNFR